MEATDHPVLYFDGVCNLCNRSVQFVIRHDKKQQFLFAPLQGEAGTIALKHLEESIGHKPDSVVLLHDNKYYIQSDAALRTLQLLGSGWQVFALLRIIPRFIRNRIYNLVAHSRYKWFGKMDSCMLPTPELKKRFLS